LEPLEILNLWWKFCQVGTVSKIKVLEPCECADLRRQLIKVIHTAVKLDDPAMDISFEASTVRNGSKSYIIPAKISAVLIHFERVFAEDEIGSKTSLFLFFLFATERFMAKNV
jgi:hypothetical protein